MCMLSRVRLFVTPWTVALQVPLISVGFFRQEYWNGLPFPPPVFGSISQMFCPDIFCESQYDALCHLKSEIIKAKKKIICTLIVKTDK